MKFLKTFLFTISLTFISFGIVTLKGFCASVALDGINSTSLPTLNTNFDIMSQFMANPDMLAYMGDQAYQDLDTYLYNTTGMDIEDHYYNGISLRQDYTALCDSTPLIADVIATKMYGSTISGINLMANGWQFIKKSAQSLGSNASAYFLGKVDSVTNQVTDACSNMVVKMTSEGLLNYSNGLSNLVSNNTLDLRSNYGPIYSDTFTLFYPSANHKAIQINFPFPVLQCVLSKSIDYNNLAPIYFICPSEYYDYRGYLNGHFNGYYLDSSGTYHSFDSQALGCTLQSNFSINGTSYVIVTCRLGGQAICVNENVGSINPPYSSVSSFAQDYLTSNPTIYDTVGYNYSSSTLSSINSLLQQLVGKYVDTDTMDRINVIIKSIPVDGVIDNDGVTVPEAVVTPEQVAELEDLIEEAIALSQDYALLLDNDITADPDPIPNNQGTEVPEDFPTTIFTPINDSVGSVFDFVSIFEPLFYIFSFSTGLLGLWLIVPFVILFLILFRLLK